MNAIYWICFGDSAEGLLRYVRRDLDDAAHILAIGDDYSQGDITDVTDRDARYPVLAPWRGDPELDGDWLEEQIGRHFAALDQLDKVDEAVIWYAKGNVHEQCGLRYVAGRLDERHIPVWVVEADRIPADVLAACKAPKGVIGGASAVVVMTDNRMLNRLLRYVPQRILRRYAARMERRRQQKRMQNGSVQYGGIGEIEPRAAAYFYQRRRRLTETEQAQLLADWKCLREENAPLRAMADGRVRSVPADFYDEIILSCVPEQTQPAAQTVGRAIGKIALEQENHVGDMLIFDRIRALARAGRLEIVHDAPTYREMTIRKCGG